MKTIRLLALAVLLNVVRYVVGAPLEKLLIFPGLFGAMAESQEYFRTSFQTIDWATSYLYNFVMWLGLVGAFHLMRPSLAVSDLVASFQAFGVGWVLFAAISFIYMNHYSHPETFYVWNVLDAIFAFSLVALANGLLYRRLMGRHAARSARS